MSPNLRTILKLAAALQVREKLPDLRGRSPPPRRNRHPEKEPDT
jgi:hypothetical protein